MTIWARDREKARNDITNFVTGKGMGNSLLGSLSMLEASFLVKHLCLYK